MPEQFNSFCGASLEQGSLWMAVQQFIIMHGVSVVFLPSVVFLLPILALWCKVNIIDICEKSLLESRCFLSCLSTCAPGSELWHQRREVSAKEEKP